MSSEEKLTMNTSEKIKNLRENRFSYPIKKKRMSELLGLSVVQLYYKYEDGTTKIPLEAIEKMCNIFYISADYFINSPVNSFQCCLSEFSSYDFAKNRYVFADIKKPLIFETFEKKENPTDYFKCIIPDFTLPYDVQHYNLFKNGIKGLEYLMDDGMTNEKNIKSWDLSLIMKKMNPYQIILPTIPTFFLIYSFTFSEYYLVRISFTESGREKIIPIYAFGNDNGFFDLEYFDLPNIDSNDKISPYITLDNIQLLGRVVRASAIPNKQ